MAATYDPSLPTARDRLRHELFDFEFFTDPVNGAALDPNETYDALITLYGEDEARFRQASAFLARFGSDVSRIRDSDGSEVAWQQRVTAWIDITKNAFNVMSINQRGMQKPLVGVAKAASPLLPGDRFDPNAQRYRGDANRRWR